MALPSFHCLILKQHQREANGKEFWHSDAAGKPLKELLASTTFGESGMSIVLLVNTDRENPRLFPCSLLPEALLRSFRS
ncbi:hypothetical protein [Aminiphilus sp.]|uniref:hypothetical protein n=1 Tax=Aminiphilus sp. TaxID=1872488 RepID=UPI00261E912D|nr:hypothetical protein [Aminiphilus sp.]